MATKQKQLFLQLQSIKNNYGSYLRLYKCFFYFERLTSNAIKNETEKNYNSLLGINLVKYSSKFLAHLSQTGTSTSVQNNCIKLSGFCVNQIFSTLGNNKKHFVPRKVLQPENSFAGFQDQPHIFLPLSAVLFQAK